MYKRIFSNLDRVAGRIVEGINDVRTGRNVNLFFIQLITNSLYHAFSREAKKKRKKKKEKNKTIAYSRTLSVPIRN